MGLTFICECPARNAAQKLAMEQSPLVSRGVLRGCNPWMLSDLPHSAGPGLFMEPSTRESLLQLCRSEARLAGVDWVFFTDDRCDI